MKTTRYFIFALASLLILGCAKEIEDPTQEERTDEAEIPAVQEQDLVSVSFKAIAEDSENQTSSPKTDINLSTGAVSWAIDDAVKFIYEVGNTPGEAVSSPLESGDIDNGIATFKVNLSQTVADAFSQANDDDHLYAVYPSSIAHDYSNASTLYVTVPSAQDGRFAGASIALAKWDKTNPTAPLQFNNLCGLLQFEISDASARSVVISSSATLAGKACITFTATGTNGKPTVKGAVTNPVTSITVNINGAGTYYAAVLPTELTDVYVSVYDAADGGGNLIGDRLANNSIPVARKQIRKLGTIATGFSDRFYVKSNGTGSGTSWGDAAPYSSLSTVFAENTTKKIYMAAGTYDVTAQIAPGTGTTSANVSILGGFPSDASGYSLSGRDYVNHPTILDAGNSARIWVLQRGKWTIDGITFQNAYRKGTDIGSALVIEGNPSQSFTVNNCTFIGNENKYSGSTADDYFVRGGGAVRVSGSVVNMNNCKFYGNTTNASGGAIGVSATGTLNATDCIFGDNADDTKANTTTTSGKGIGGAIHVNGTATLDNCTFANNSAAYRGGAVSLTAAGKLTIKNCTFSNNVATSCGGAIYPHSLTEGSALLSVDNTLFSNNSAGAAGGGAVGTGSDSGEFTGLLTFTKCKFDGNSTDATSFGGGAVQANGAGFAFVDCSFTSNRVLASATNESPSGGGAVFSSSTSATKLFFERCFFANNGMFQDSDKYQNRWGHHICVSSTTALLGINNCVIRGPWGITLTDDTFKGRGSAITSRCQTVISNTTVYARLGNVMITQGYAGENGFRFINSIAINCAGTPNCFNNYDTSKYLNMYYSLYTQIRTNSKNTTPDGYSIAGVTNTLIGWEKDGLGSAKTVSDKRGSFYYYPWTAESFTINEVEKTVSKPDLQTVKGLISGTTGVGTAFLTWLESDALKVGTHEALEVDIRGEARNTSAMWPGSYQGASAPASAAAFNMK